MPRPTISALPSALARAAQAAGRRFDEAGARVWIVGGAVRDLALGLAPHDLDLASALPPDAVERLFPQAVPVGRDFGTLVLPLEGLALQHTSFRSDADYSDRRRPDSVRFGSTLEEDARRRDFTCNALYLDPLRDELRDPEGGLADLEAGLLRCVGDPAARLSEDGLRLLRLARFAAGYGLAIEPRTARAAPGALPALAGVSAERIAGELERMCERPGLARALAILAELGVLRALVERFAPRQADAVPERLAVLARLPEPVALAELLAVLLCAERDEQLAALRALRTSRELQRAVLAIADDRARLRALVAAPPARLRAARVRLVREASWPSVARLARAAGEVEPRALDELEAFAAALAPEELRPAPLLASADLAAAGVPRGPRWGELLLEAEERQLEGELRTRAEALSWLASAR